MSSKTRTSAASLFSTSSKALETQENLAQAQERIKTLEQELSEESYRLRSQVQNQTQVSQATVAIDSILRRPYQSRRERDPQAFDELVHSIRTYGFRGSIWVQQLSDNKLRLIAGETRLDAAIAAGLSEITVDIVDTDDITAVKLSRVENSRRRGLNALDDTEELLYLLMLVLDKNRKQTISDLYRYKNAIEGSSSIDASTQEKIEATFQEVAPDLGIVTFITSRLPLLSLPEDVLLAYNDGKLEYTKAIELARLEDQSVRQDLLGEIVEQGLSLSALKSRIRPPSTRTIVDKVVKVSDQIQGVTPRAIRKLTPQQKSQLIETFKDLELIVKAKLEELEE
jgi:ParB family transcriptional regulator, chromosome partitioning protein